MDCPIIEKNVEKSGDKLEKKTDGLTSIYYSIMPLLPTNLVQRQKAGTIKWLKVE